MISNGNSKIGSIQNLSLSPIKSCVPGIPCSRECYAIKAFRMYPPCKALWDNNLSKARKNVGRFFMDLQTEFNPGNRFFRIHIAGDFFSQEYLDGWKSFCRKYPTTKFLAFTKAHNLNFSNLPKNLTIVFSMWTNWGNTKKPFRRAWLLDHSNIDNRIPENAILCPGSCENCMQCWALPDIGRDVVFEKH